METELLKLVDRKDWIKDAACVGMDPEIFFSDTRRVKTKPETRLALDTCNKCPVSEECLQENMGELFGIFGGKTAEERQKIRSRTGSMRTCTMCGKKFSTKSVHMGMCSDECRHEKRRMVRARSDANRYAANLHRSRK